MIQMKQRGSDDARLPTLRRARVVCDAILELASSKGQWIAAEIGKPSDGLTGRLWTLDVGEGLSAMIAEHSLYERPKAADPTDSEPFFADLAADNTIDLYSDQGGKIMSYTQFKGQGVVVRYTSGPWEAQFGLPERPWPRAVSRAIEKRSART